MILIFSQTKIDFFTDWDRGVSGIVGKGGVHQITNDFAMKLKFIVNAGANTGYYAQVKREHDGEER